jgi:hypothetical protein
LVVPPTRDPRSFGERVQTAADAAAAVAQQAYQDQRDLQKQGLQDINDDQKILLQQHLDDLGGSLTQHLGTWKWYVGELAKLGVNTAGLLDPSAGTGTAGALNVAGAGSESGANGYVKMATGGLGAVSRPTLFLAGEAGPEQFAFSGAGKSFSGGGGDTYYVTVNADRYVGNRTEFAQEVVKAFAQANRRGSVYLPGLK